MYKYNVARTEMLGDGVRHTRQASTISKLTTLTAHTEIKINTI